MNPPGDMLTPHINLTREEARDLSRGKWCLDYHLRDTVAAEGLAADKLLALQTSQRVEEGSDREDDGSRNETRGARYETNPLDSTHGGVHSRAHVVGGEAADEGIELGGSRANTEEERYLNEEDDEGTSPAKVRMGCHHHGRLAGLTGR